MTEPLSKSEGAPAHAVSSPLFGQRARSVALLQLSLFFLVWSVYGIAINSANLNAFNLQHAGIEAMVERKQFSLEGSATPQFQIKVYYDGDKPFGDTFMYNGRQFAAKQPGQFMIGAVVYFLLRLFGLSYLNNYTVTSALVSLFTSSLVAALGALAVFRIASQFTRESLAWPLTSAVLYAFGTTAFAYSSFAYHDTLASGFLVIAFYWVMLLSRQQVSRRNAPLVAVGAGVLLGLTITTSMLPFFMTCAVGGYLVWINRWKIRLAAIAGGLVGIAPLLYFNASAFGNPLLNSYSAGDYPPSSLTLNLQNSIDKAWLYASEITLYDPIAWLGILALAFYPRALRRELLLILVLFAAQALQVLNITSHGGCHYGPRFLLPALPYAALGLVGFHYLRSQAAKRAAIIVIVLAGAASVTINSVGTLFGAMYCDVHVYGFWPGIATLQQGNLNLPLAKWLVIPALVSLLLFGYSIYCVAIRSSREPGRLASL
ncbi:MAG TPA: hypothetical protein VNO50_16280 [Pyrinomonadaceae bacterium]|nr:hypothetical protein [Pyrinomonadaceae bacterium]